MLCVNNNTTPQAIDLAPALVDRDAPPIEVKPVQMCTWKTAYQVAVAVFYYLLFPITYPLKLLLNCTIIPELIGRSLIFMTDLYRAKFGWLGEGMLKGIGLTSTLDLPRLETAKRRFETIGAEFVTVRSADGQEFEMMRLTQESFRQAVADHGGKFVWHDDREIIEGGDADLTTALKKLGWPEVEGGFQFRQRTVLQEGETGGLVMRIHPYSHLAFFERSYLINHLALGKDIVTYDSRGHREGDHLCSEHGIYLDAETAYRQVRTHWDYKPEDIWITSKCGGTSAVLHLRERFREDFHMVIENSFLRYVDTTYQNIPIAHWIGLDVLSCLKDEPHDADLTDICCNNFDNQAKLEHLATSEKDWQSNVVVISAKRDLTVEPDAGHKLAELGAKVSGSCYHLIHDLPDEQADGHRDEATVSDAALFAAYSQILTGGRQVVQLNCA